MKKQFTSFILTIAMIIAMIPAVSLPAFATSNSNTIDVSDNVNGTLPAGVSYGSNLFTIGTGANNNTITIIGTTSTNTIKVSSGVTGLTLILNGVSITNITTAPIDIQSSANVTIQLAGGSTNELNAYFTPNSNAGLNVPGGATVTINGTGTLNVTGGYGLSGGGAGIGGSVNGTVGTINISESAIIIAKAGGGGAGIGSGQSGTSGTINIDGNANVTATGTNNGAGIGGGYGTAGGTINISGNANVTAKGHSFGAGIGGGQNGAGGTIDISVNANVTATGGTGVSAGIGGGDGGGKGNVTISTSGIVMAASMSIMKPAIDAASGSTGSVINANLNSAISTSAKTYLRCNANTLELPAYYCCFAFNAAADSLIKAYSDQACNTFIADIVTTPGGSKNIPLSATIYSAPTSVAAAFALTMILNGGSGSNVSGTYASSTVVAIDAGTKSGNTFSGWTSSNGGTFGTASSAATTFTMPGNATTITANWTPVNTLTVNLNGGNGGTVGGSYASSTAVSINAGTKSGYTFSSWTSSNGGTFGSASSASTTFTMPGNATTITANWTPTYALTVNLGGGNGSTVSGAYASGAAVSIDAGTKSGYTFSSWTSSNGGTFGSASSASTTFTMPGNATTITAVWTQSSDGGGGGGGGGSHTLPGTNITIDDEKYTIGDENKDGTDTTVTIDQNKFDDGIEKASDHSGVIIPVSGNANMTARLVVKNIEDMAKKEMTLTVQTGKISYNLDTAAVDTAKITAALGMSDTSKIPFDVKIANSNAMVNGTTVVLSPVEFTITAVYNGKTVDVDKFSSFVDRTIEITADQAKKVTTAVVVEPSGSLRHVPTKVTVIDGKYYAVINSLTNSTYSVIWHPVEFSDVTAHWAKDTINDMGSRMVISGVGQGNFEPDRDITRAEFAAIVVRALGLAPGNGTSSFNDVSNSDWYSGYVKTAAEYGIITGYDAATFSPSDKITREQAMTMIARAMKTTGLKTEMKDNETTELFANYLDGTAASDYAKINIAACLKTGMVTGRTSDTIAPKDCITRAEVAVIVQRLLQKSDLI